MVAPPLHRQFAGQARLVRLLLWRIGDSTDLETCFSVAKDAHMISDDDEVFLRSCMELEEDSRDDSARVLDIDRTTIERLRRCADKLNRADSA